MTDEDVEWLKAYVSNVVGHFSPLFADDRFQQGDTLIKKFEAGLESILRDGRERFRALDETHNEICVAGALLAMTDPLVLQLDYEPVLDPSGRSIDFRAVIADGRTVFVDVKTIRPVAKDRWDQFERATKEGWLPDDVSVVLDKEWLGGEIWHSMFASRSRMLEYTLELESKIGEVADAEGAVFVIAFCGRAYDWHEDELEDFVSFYRSGQHRSDDPFGQAEAHYLEEQKLRLSGRITRFAYLRREYGETDFRRLNWNVQPPRIPSF